MEGSKAFLNSYYLKRYMKRGFYVSFVIICLLTMIPSAFSLASIGGERNYTSQTITESAEKSTYCLQFQTVGEQIQCRLTATHLLPIQPVFCTDTVETSWCQNLLTDAIECFAFNGTEKDACFISKAQSYSVLEYSESDSYVLLLLLDLVQSVEDAYDEDKITIREASFLIEKLVIIAHAKLRHEPTFLIATLYSEYRYYWEQFTYVRVY
mgnify:CR=1 FL=1